MIRQAAERTRDAVGDGTSTLTVLAYTLFAEGVKNAAAGTFAVGLRRGLDRVGQEGVITVEEAKATETMLEVVEGMQFDHGYLSPYFITDPAKMEAVLDDPLVLLHEKRLTSLKDLVPLLEQVAKAGRSLLIVAEDVDGKALAAVVVYKVRGVLHSCRRQGPRLRRPPQGNPPGHRRPDRRHRLRGGGRPVARGRQADRPGQGEARNHRPRDHDDHRGRQRAEGHRRPLPRDPPPGRGDQVRLRPRKAAGAAGEALRRRRGDASMAEGIVPCGGLALLRAIDAVARK